MAILFSDSIGITEKYIWFVSHDGIFLKVNKLTGKLEIIHTDIQEFVDFGNSVDNILNININNVRNNTFKCEFPNKEKSGRRAHAAI